MEITKSRQEKRIGTQGQKLVTDTTTVSYNINHMVRVRLTSHGFDHWMKKHGEMAGAPSMWSSVVDADSVERYMAEQFAEVYNIHYIGDGWCEFQLYRLIGLFGSALESARSSDLPFSTEIMLIEHDAHVLEASPAP